jgi:hypothetical protein
MGHKLHEKPHCLTNYAIQCRDISSGEIGCFLFDTEHWMQTREFKAISPVFPGLDQFFDWCHENGNPQKGIYIEASCS